VDQCPVFDFLSTNVDGDYWSYKPELKACVSALLHLLVNAMAKRTHPGHFRISCSPRKFGFQSLSPLVPKLWKLMQPSSKKEGRKDY
jgi:hypothetical protein